MGVVEIERVTSPTVGRGGEIRDGDSSRAKERWLCRSQVNIGDR